MKTFFKGIYNFFDKLEDKIRVRLTHLPVIYALIGSVGIVLIWRGIWVIADDMLMPGWVSLALGVGITLSTGLFVSFFIGDGIIISGLNKDKRIDEKTEKEIHREEEVLEEIQKDIEELKDAALHKN